MMKTNKDDQYLDSLRNRVGKGAHDAHMRSLSRNLSVDVVNAVNQPSTGKKWIGISAVSAAMITTAIILILTLPVSDIDQEQVFVDDVLAFDNVSSATMATDYLSVATEDLAIETIATDVYTDPTFVTDEDLDLLFEDL